MEHQGAEPEGLEKIWSQVEKFGAAVGCVYISRPDVQTKYGLLISRRHFPILISEKRIFAKSQKDPATNLQNPEKSVAGREILGCGWVRIYTQARHLDNLQTSVFAVKVPECKSGTAGCRLKQGWEGFQER